MPAKYADVTRPVRVLVLELDDKQTPILQEAAIARRAYYARSGTPTAQVKLRIIEEVLDQLGVDVSTLETPPPSPGTPAALAVQDAGPAALDLNGDD